MPTLSRPSCWLLLLLLVASASCGPVHELAPAPVAPPATQPASRPATQPASRPATQPASEPACNSWIVEYEAVPGTALKLADTPYGAGDGIYAIGPGTARVRFADRNGAPAAGDAALLDLQLTTKFVVGTTALGFKMRIATDGTVGFTPDQCGVVARGTFQGDQLTFAERARGYHSAGTLHCTGALCGKFGSPPPGRSQMTRAPRLIKLRSLQLRDGVSRLSTGYFEVERQRKPSQTVHLRLEAREVSRRCVITLPCAAQASP